MNNVGLVTKLKETPFTLVLSGGGALGAAHIGVLQDLERFYLTPNEIVGTSMGGIIGACLAIGMSAQEIAVKVEEFGSFENWFDFTLSGNSINDDDKIRDIFKTIFGSRTMAQTDIGLKLVTTNLLTGDKKVFDARDSVLISDALLATMAIPGIFKEQQIDGQILADGFLCENLAVCEATKQTILAVDVLGRNSFRHSIPDNFFKTKNVLEMFERSMRLLIYNQTKSVIAHCDKEIFLLEPKTESFKTYSFNKIKSISELGKGLIESYIVN